FVGSAVGSASANAIDSPSIASPEAHPTSAPRKCMHICFINPPIEFYSPISGGAVATIAMEQARQLLNRGHEVTVLTPVNGDPIYPIGNVVPIQVRRREDLNILQRALSKIRRKLFQWDWPYYEWYRDSFLS